MFRVQTPIEVQRGTWRGNVWRRARKPGRCDYFRGAAVGKCRNRIEAGDLYLEGEMNEEAGGFGCDRYCAECAGEEAREVVAAEIGDRQFEPVP